MIVVVLEGGGWRGKVEVDVPEMGVEVGRRKLVLTVCTVRDLYRKEGGVQLVWKWKRCT